MAPGTMAWTGATVPAIRAAIVPSSVEKMNRAPPKLGVPLKTRPVGADGNGPVGFGIVTTKGAPTGKGWPALLYNVETPVPLSDTHHGLVGVRVNPQELTRFGSTVAATPGRSETSLSTT